MHGLCCAKHMEQLYLLFGFHNLFKVREKLIIAGFLSAILVKSLFFIYSTFCTCSLSFSISTLRETPISARLTRPWVRNKKAPRLINAGSVHTRKGPRPLDPGCFFTKKQLGLLNILHLLPELLDLHLERNPNLGDLAMPRLGTEGVDLPDAPSHCCRNTLR